MKSEDIEAIDRAELNHGCGYDDRWQNKPFNENETEAWQQGWREADYELSGDENAEF
jgi:hypothetical protein